MGTQQTRGRQVAVLALLALAAKTASAAGPGEPLARFDALHARRDEAAVEAELERLIARTLEQHPNEYGVLWRAARFYFWQSDRPALAAGARTRLARRGWELGERATAANPNGGPGYFWTAVNIGNYGLGVGVFRALREGLEGKFKENLSSAGALASDYEHGAIEVAWGRFYQELPWPKRDLGKGERHYRAALRRFPENLRARVYLAEVLARKQPAEARQLLEQVLAAPVGLYDAPEERRAKQLARRQLEALRSS